MVGLDLTWGAPPITLVGVDENTTLELKPNGSSELVERRAVGVGPKASPPLRNGSSAPPPPPPAKLSPPARKGSEVAKEVVAMGPGGARAEVALMPMPKGSSEGA